MAAVSLGAVTYGSPSFTADGKWVETFSIGPRVYEIGHPDGAGVDGVGFKRFGYRQRRLTFACWYVSGSENAAIADASADMDTLTNTKFDVTVGGTSYPVCELEDNSTFAEPHKCGTAGKFLVIATFSVMQRGLVA